MSTLLLSGWTQPADALAGLADDPVLFDYSEHASPDAAIMALRAITADHVIGWSMGGQLALRAIAAGALRPRHLTLLAAPVQFVSHHDGLAAMDATTYELFRESYMKDATRTMTRFHGLIAKGETDMRAVMDRLSHHHDVANVARWLPWLEDLARYRLSEAELASAVPMLIIHGMPDAIVPHAQGEYLARTLPNARLSSWATAGHAPHAHDIARLRAEIDAHRREHGVA